MPFQLDWTVPVTDAHLCELTGEKRTRVELFHVEIISLVVERLYQHLHYPNGVGKIILYQLSFLAVVHTHLLKVSCFAVWKYKCFDTPGVWLSFQVLAKGDCLCS